MQWQGTSRMHCPMISLKLLFIFQWWERKRKEWEGEIDLKQLCLTIYLPCVHASHSYSWVTAMDAHKVLKVLSTNPSREELVHDMLKSITVSSLFSSDINVTSLLLLATFALPFPMRPWSRTRCMGNAPQFWHTVQHKTRHPGKGHGKLSQHPLMLHRDLKMGLLYWSLERSGKGKRGWEWGSDWSHKKLQWCQECSNFCLQTEKQRYLIWFKINIILALGWHPTVTFIGIFLRPFPLQYCTPCILSHSEISCGWDNLPHSAVVTQHLLAMPSSQLGPLVPDQIIWFGYQIKDELCLTWQTYTWPLHCSSFEKQRREIGMIRLTCSRHWNE